MFTFTVWYSLPEQNDDEANEDLWVSSVDEIYEMFERRFDSGLKDLGDCDPGCGMVNLKQHATFFNVPGTDYNDAVGRVKSYLRNVPDLKVDKVTQGDDIQPHV